MKWSETFDKMTGIVDDDKARRVLNVSTRTAQVTAEELETGVTLERLAEIGVPVFRYQTQVTIHGRLPDFNPDTRPGGYKAVFRNQNGSIGVKYCAVDLPKKLALQEACELTDKTRHWHAFRDSTGFRLQRCYGDRREDAVECLKTIPRDLFIGSAYGARHPWTGWWYIVVEVAAVPQEHLAALVTWFSGATAEQLAEMKRVRDEERAAERAKWEAEVAEGNRKRKEEAAARLEQAKAYAATLPMTPLTTVPKIGTFRRVAIDNDGGENDGKPVIRVIELAKRGPCLCVKADNWTKWRKVTATDTQRWEGACKNGLLFPAEQVATAGRTVTMPNPLTLGVNEIVVSENESKNGVEIRFAAKPSMLVLAELKAAGWHWSRFNRCWYKTRTEASLKFAHDFAANKGMVMA